MIVMFFPGAEPPGRSPHTRRRARSRPSLHIHRRALIRRLGLHSTGRPACVLDTIARQLLAARVV
jgi:hypothetical protein